MKTQEQVMQDLVKAFKNSRRAYSVLKSLKDHGYQCNRWTWILASEMIQDYSKEIMDILKQYLPEIPEYDSEAFSVITWSDNPESLTNL